MTPASVRLFRRPRGAGGVGVRSSSKAASASAVTRHFGRPPGLRETFTARSSPRRIHPRTVCSLTANRSHTSRTDKVLLIAESPYVRGELIFGHVAWPGREQRGIGGAGRGQPARHLNQRAAARPRTARGGGG